ncbi:MAG: hypothetical protein M0Q42_02180 [Xanthomonadales bacterium]|nr:hypothetical protein [Xanthomonadales bacterium]
MAKVRVRERDPDRDQQATVAYLGLFKEFETYRPAAGSGRTERQQVIVRIVGILPDDGIQEQVHGHRLAGFGTAGADRLVDGMVIEMGIEQDVRGIIAGPQA